MARVNIPKNLDDKLALAAKVFAKHQADGAASPIGGLGWAQTGPTIATTQQLRTDAGNLKRQSELKNEQANNAGVNIEDIVRRARDILLGLHRDNPRKLADWGFEVDDSPQSPAKPPTP